MRAISRKNTKRFLFAGIDFALENKDFDQANLLRSKVKAIIMEDAQGLVIRSRERETAEEERGSLYHAAREIRRGPNAELERLEVDGVETSDQDRIQKEVEDFFSALYRGHHRSRMEGGRRSTLTSPSCQTSPCCQPPSRA